MTDLMPMPPMGGQPPTQPSPADLPQALTDAGPQGPRNGGPLAAVEGIIGALAAIEQDLGSIAEQFPAAAEQLRAAVNAVRQAATIVLGTAQTGSRSPFVPVRG